MISSFPFTLVTILFRPVANAPILQEPKLRAPATRQFSVLAAYLRTRLKLTASDSLYLYINSAFIPAPDAVIGDLFASFATRGELTINYALAQAWG
jgi:ubiquitin-like protein ATG12